MGLKLVIQKWMVRSGYFKFKIKITHKISLMDTDLYRPTDVFSVVPDSQAPKMYAPGYKKIMLTRIGL